jgi:RNA polymerase sigma factor (sigma-70 family)
LRTSGARFTATRWSIVLVAADHQAGTASRRALEELIRAYWFPLYAFVRRQGNNFQQAEDVVQEFFTRLLEKEYLAQVDRSKGKFRSFLLAAVKHFLSKERDRLRAQKRGGRCAVIALDALDAEARYAVEPADDMTPDRLFERQWALAVLDQVIQRLSNEYAAGGKSGLYAAIEPCLTSGAQAVNYDLVSRELGMTEGAVRVAVHRLRRRYRDLLRNEIAQTVDSPGEVEEEISYLLNCL